MAATDMDMKQLHKMLSSLAVEQRNTPPDISPKATGSTVFNKDQHCVDFLNDEKNTMILLTLRKPTELKKVVDSVIKPVRAVPKNGLPIWYKLGLECKLPVPKMPQGKIVFSRGKMGEDVRRIGLGAGFPSPTFDLTDPYCYNVSYDYVAVHDPHLKFYFRQKAASNRMKDIGFATPDGRAICSLKEFNTYRKYLYNRFMDRINDEMNKLDERAKDDLTLKKVEADVARRQQAFLRTEKAREHLEKHSRLFSDEIAEKKRLAKEKQKKVEFRMQYLTEMNKQKRKERAQRIQEKDNRVKQRVQAASEMELRRKITMIRQWRSNEKRRLQRLKQNREAKIRKMEDDAERMWQQRVESQNQKIQKEAMLLQLYVDDMNNAANRRHKKAQIYAYNTDLQLQSIRIRNLREIHGGVLKKVKLVKKMGYEFEKSKRGAKGMTTEVAHQIARNAMSYAMSTGGDMLMTLGQARARMDLETVLPTAPIKILDMILENVVVEFARRRVHLLLRDVERVVDSRALNMFLGRKASTTSIKSRSRAPRQSVQMTTALASQFATHGIIAFGEVVHIAPEEEFTDVDLKRTKDRPPTPVPSLTKLAEVTFSEKVEDLPDPISMPNYLPERKKILEMINVAAKLMSRYVSVLVHKGMDLTLGKVTLPNLRVKLEWGEAVEGLSEAVVNNSIKPDSADIRRACEFLSHRILCNLKKQMRIHKERQKSISMGRPASYENPAPPTDFYVPGKAESLPDEDPNDKVNTTLQFSPNTMGGNTPENKSNETKKP
ncbi:hypothetical protein O0L34_g9853 [Tuta absoluta]|nr:hypothetical protein O0L34_g9853 [Tuta absoluta]